MNGCCFLGHKNCPEELKNRIFHTVELLITEKGVTQFYVGTQGGFDRLVYQVLCELEEKYKIQVFVVLAYLHGKPNTEYYDYQKTIFPDVLTKTPLRFAISRRNSFMITQSDYVVAYINTTFSRAYGNIEEAIRKKKQIINLGNYDIQSIVL